MRSPRSTRLQGCSCILPGQGPAARKFPPAAHLLPSFPRKRATAHLGSPSAPQNPREVHFPTGMAQTLLGFLARGESRARKCVHVHIQPETPSLPACSPAAAGGFTVNKTTAENDLSSGKEKNKKRLGWGGERGKKNNPPFFLMSLSLIRAAHPSPGFHPEP